MKFQTILNSRFSLTSILTASLVAFTPSLVHAQDAELIAVLKTQAYFQSSGSDIDLDSDPHIFEVYIEASAVDSVVLIPSIGPNISIPEEVAGMEFFYDEKFASKAAFDAAYPNDNYSLDVKGANDGTKTVNLDFMGSDAYLPAPLFTDYDAAQALDHTVKNTLFWGPVTGALASDWMFLEIQDSNENLVFESAFPGEVGALTGVSTSIEIPENTLEFGKAYSVRLSVIRRVDTSADYPGADSFAAFQTVTTLDIMTVGPDSDAPILDRSIPAYGQEEVSLNSVVTFLFNEAMDPSVDEGNAISWTGLPDPNTINYSWSADNRVLFCAHPGGLPADSTIGWALNPLGSSAKLRDTAGNELASPGEQGEFRTSASSNVGASDARQVELYKAASFTQAADTPVAAGEYFVDLLVDLNGISTVSSVDLDVPGVGTMTDIGTFEYDFEEIYAEESFADPDELNAKYPPGDYGVALHTVNDGVRNLILNPGAGDYPSTPTVLNFSTTQDWDSTQPFTLTWNPMEGGTAGDVIFVTIESDDGVFFESPCFGEPLALTGESTSITIPANMLPPGRTLEAEVAFLRVNTNDTTQYPGARLVSGIASLTTFLVQTAGTPYTPEVNVRHDGTMATIEVTGELGSIYDLYGSEDLGEWAYITTLFLFDDPNGFLRSASFEDFLSNGSPKKFYQLEDAVGQ